MCSEKASLKKGDLNIMTLTCEIETYLYEVVRIIGYIHLQTPDTYGEIPCFLWYCFQMVFENVSTWNSSSKRIPENSFIFFQITLFPTLFQLPPVFFRKKSPYPLLPFPPAPFKKLKSGQNPRIYTFEAIQKPKLRNENKNKL